MDFPPPKRIRTLGVFLCLLVLLIPAPAAQAQSTGGIAISGSFYRHHYKMIPGEKMESSQAEIVVYNNYNLAIQVKITATAPKGVEINLADQVLDMPANTNQTLPVLINLAEEVVPGEYEIRLAADVVPSNVQGVSVVGSAELVTHLTIFGESGKIAVNTITPDNQPFYGLLRLFRKENEQLSPAGEFTGGALDDRLVPGDYVLIEYYNGETVAETQFTIAPDDDKKVTLTAQTLFVDGLSAVPVMREGTQNISSARIDYTLRNIFETTAPLTLKLVVSYNGSPLEELDMVTIPGIDLGTQSNRFTYIPPEGWKNGKYSFEVHALSGGILYGKSKPSELELSTANGADWLSGNVPLFGAAGLVIMVILYVLARKPLLKK